MLHWPELSLTISSFHRDPAPGGMAGCAFHGCFLSRACVSPVPPSFHQQLAGFGSGGGGCPWLYPLLPLCCCLRAISSPSERRDALGQVPRDITGMSEAARTKFGMAGSGQGQASSGWGQPGDREGRNGPRRSKSALLPQHILGTELGQSSERETEQGSGDGALKTSQRMSSR